MLSALENHQKIFHTLSKRLFMRARLINLYSRATSKEPWKGSGVFCLGDKKMRAPAASAPSAPITTIPNSYDSVFWKPVILFSSITGGCNSCFIASNIVFMVWSCSAYFFSSASIFTANSPCVRRISLNLVKARIIRILTYIALSLFNTLESIATPCSVKA